MKKYSGTFQSLIFLLCSVAFNAQGQDQVLKVIVKNVKDDKGVVAVALYNSEDSFMKKMLQGKIAKSKPGEVEVTFDPIPAGTYAVSVLHDVNENGKMDSNAIGIPKEGFGFSNDAMGKFGPPPFGDAKFVFPINVPLVITMRYPGKTKN